MAEGNDHETVLTTEDDQDTGMLVGAKRGWDPRKKINKQTNKTRGGNSKDP